MAKAGTKHKADMEGLKQHSRVENMCSRRSKLKEPIDFKALHENGGGQIEFEIEMPEDGGAGAADEMKENIDKQQKKKRLAYFDNCKLRNITAKAVSDDSTENTVLLSSFAYLATKFENVTDDGGVKKKLERVGNGKTPPLNGRVWINYEAWLEESDEPFDFNDHRKKPYCFKLFQNEVLAVLEYGVASMEMKEKSRFLATPEYAYGPLGIPGRVPPNSVVLFVIELLDFMEAASLNTVFKMSAEERALLNFDEIQKAANELKMGANQYCMNKQWASAIPKYRKAMHMLERYLTPNADVDQQRNSFLFVLYNNMAMCYLQLKEFQKSIDMTTKALQLPPNTKGNMCKAYYRQAQAEYELGHFDEAKRVARIALNHEPMNTECRVFYDKVEERIIADKEVQKKLFRRMFAKMNLGKEEDEDERVIGLHGGDEDMSHSVDSGRLTSDSE